MNFKKKLQAAMPKMIGNPLSVATAMVSFALSVVKGQKAKKATKGKKKTTVRKSKIMSKKQQMEVMERICQSAYGTYIRGVTTVAARYIGHPAVAIPASEMIKTIMEKNAPPVSRPFVTITNEQMNSLKIEERRGGKEYLKTKDTREKRERLPFSQPIRDMGLLWNRMWGYEDDAPVAGQPFYDMSELFNDLSNYLEESIIDSCEYTKKNFEEQAIQMYGDGEGAQILRALGGLEIEEELNLGGKIGAAGKGAMNFVGNGIASILLAAASPIETIKAITNAERPSQDEVVERVIQERKEFEKLPEQKKWEKRGYVAGETIDTILITRGILKGALKSISVDDFVEAGVKAGSKVDNIAEAGAKVTSKVDDVAEAGTKVTSKVDDVVEAGAKASSKVDDVVEAEAKAGSKADDVAEVGMKASSKANDTAKTAGQTTARTVVKDNSGANGSGVEFSGKKSNPNIDDIKTRETSNSTGNTEKPKETNNNTSNSNAADTNNAKPIIDIEFQNAAQIRVKELRNQLPNSDLRKYGNVATADVDIAGIKKEFYAHSKINSFEDKGSNIAEFSYLKSESERNFSSYKIDRYPRYHDTEAKILEDVASQIKEPNISGTINLFTERPPCESCSNIIEEFKEKFPNIELNVFSEKGKWIDLKKKGEKL